MRVAAAACFICAFLLLFAWANEPERPIPYPVGQPGATPIAYVPTPTPIGFRALGIPTETVLGIRCGHRLEPASLRCLQRGAVRPEFPMYSYATGGR